MTICGRLCSMVSRPALLLSFLAAALVLLSVAPQALSETTRGHAKVIDGDSLEINGQSIRLVGIDAPEGVQWCNDSQGIKYRCGNLSTAWMFNATTGKEVRCEWTERDKYKRLLGTCFVGTVNINARSVEAGWSVAYRKYSTSYVAQEDSAKAAKRGLWAGQFQMPWDWRMAQRGETTKSTKKTTPQVAKTCCRICRKGKACGNTCIKRSYTCTKSRGCACDAQ